MFAPTERRKCLARVGLPPRPRRRRARRLAVESLEARRLLAYSVELTPTNEVVFLGDQADDNLILQVLPDGQLQYTTIGLGGLNSSTDLDTSIPGQQPMQVDQIARLTVDGGTGTDRVSIVSALNLTLGGLSLTSERILIETSTVQSAAKQTFVGTLVLTEDTTFTTLGTDFDASAGWITSDEAGPYQLDIVTLAADGASGSVFLSQVGDADGAGLENRGVGQMRISAGGNTAGDLVFDRASAGDVSIDLSDADFFFDGGDVRLHDSTRIDTQQDTDNNSAGSLFLGPGDVYSAVGDLTLSLDTSATGTAQGGDVTLGPVNDHGDGFFLQSLQVDSRGGPTGADGRIDVGDDILVDGGLVRLSGPVTVGVDSGATMLIDTEQDNTGPAGDIDLRQATVTAANENVGLSLVASTGDVDQSGGIVTLGSFSPIAGQRRIVDLEVDTAGGSNGGVSVPVALRVDGNILFQNSVTVDIDGDVEAENNLSVRNTQNVDLAANVDLTSVLGDLRVTTDVVGIDLSGVDGANIFSAGGSLSLAPIADRGSPQTVVVTGGDDVTLNSVILDGAASPVLDIFVDQALGGGQFLAGALRAGTIALSSNHDVTISGPITATSGAVTVTVSDTGISGNLTLTDGALITSLSSNVELRAGDDIGLRPGTVIDAAGTLGIQGDFDPDNSVNDPLGTRIEILGAILAVAADIRGDVNDDTFILDAQTPSPDGSGPELVVTGAAGSDTFNVRATSGPTTIEGGDGDDVTNVSSDAPDMSTGTVDGITHALTVNGGEGEDALNVSDRGDITGDDATLDAAEINGLGNDGTITYAVESLDLSLAAGDDTLLVIDTHAGATTIDTNDGDDLLNIRATSGNTTAGGGAGNDSFHVSSTAPERTTGTLDGIAAALTINGDGGSNTLRVSDMGDVTGDNGTLTATEIGGLGNGAPITYAVDVLDLDLGSGNDVLLVAGTHAGITTINTHAGNDTVNVQATGGPSAINAGEGNDALNVSSNAPEMETGTVDAIAALLSVNGEGGVDTVHVSDQGETASENGTLTATEIAGLGNAGAITYAAETLNLDLGAGGDSLRVSSTHGGLTTIRGNAGEDTLNVLATGGPTTVEGGRDDDTVNVSSEAPDMSTGTVDGITHALTVNGGEGEDALNVSDRGDITGDDATLDAAEINGLGNDGTITYAVELLDLSLAAGDDTLLVIDTHAGATTIDTNDGDDLLNIRATSGNTTAGGGAGNDSFHVSSTAPERTTGTLDGIAAALTINGDGGSNTLRVSDMGDVTGDNGTLTATEIGGLGNGAPITYAVDVLDLDLGSGNDVLLVAGTHAGITTINTHAGNDTVNVQATGGPSAINAGEGNDALNVSSNAPEMETGTVDAIAALLSVNGEGGVDTVHVSDQGETASENGTLTATEIAGLGNAGAITYAAETLNLDLGAGGDSLRVSSTHGGLTTIRGNAGEDTLNVLATGGPTTVEGGRDDDTVNVSSEAPDMSTGTVDGITHALTVNGGEGEDALNVSDRGDITGDDATLDAAEINGLGNDGTITYAVELLDLSLAAGDDTLLVIDTHAGATTIDTNDGDDLLNIRATSGNTTAGGGAGNDSFHVSSTAPERTTGTLDGIAAALTINGDGGSNTLRVSDMGDVTGDNGTLTATEIDGLGNGAPITYAVDVLDLDLGSGNDVLLVAGTHAGITTINTHAGNDTVNVQATGGPSAINAGEGNDALNVSSNAPEMETGTVDAITAPLSVNGEGGVDTVHVSDQGDTASENGTLTATEIAGLGNAGAITYAAETLNLDLGAGGDSLRVSSTHGGLTTIRGNAGDDRLNIHATGGPTAVHGNEGNDTFNVGEGDLDAIRGPITVTGDVHRTTPTRAVAAGGEVQTLGEPVGPDGYTTNSKFEPGEAVDQAVGDRLNLMDGLAAVSSSYLVAPFVPIATPQVFEVTVVSSPDGPETPPRQFSMVNYSTIETVELVGGTQNDVIEIQWADAEPLAHLLVIGGGGGDDNYLILRGTSSGDAITVDDTNPEEKVRAPVEIDNIGRFRVRGGSGDDVIHNKSASPALLEGDDGDDILVTDEARQDVLTGGRGRDALFGTGTGTFYLPDAEVNEVGDLSEFRVDGDLVVADGSGGRVSSLGKDKVSGRACGEGELFVDGGQIGVLCWLKAIFLANSRPIIEGPDGAQVRIDQLTVSPQPNDSSDSQGSQHLAVPPLTPSSAGAGDANLDGYFDLSDIKQVLRAATYRTGQPAQWDSGDWNGDGLFDQRDLVVALQTSTYGLRSHAAESGDDETGTTDAALAMTDDWLVSR